MRFRPTLVVSAVPIAAFAVLVVAFGGQSRATGVAQHDYLGAASCRSCHEAEYQTWLAGPHANTLEQLGPNERKDPRCLQCHTLLPSDPDPVFAGVQCETCHGPGRYYAKDHVMRDADLRARLLFAEPTEATCKACHTDSTPRISAFDYQSALERIRHWQDPAPEAAAETEPAK